MKNKNPKILCRGKYLRLLSRNGWEFVRRNDCTGIVVIAAITRDRKMIFVEQYRPPLDKRVIEMPAGLVGDHKHVRGEKFEAAAFRELLEETGYEAGRLELVIQGPVSCGMSGDQYTFFRATRLKKTREGGGNEDEDITVHEVPIGRIDSWLKSMIRKGRLVDPKVYAGVYFLLKK